MFKKGWFPFAVMLVFLVFSWGFDMAKQALKNYRSQTFTSSSLWVDFFIELVFAALVIGIILFLAHHPERTVASGITFLVVGLVIFFLCSPFAIYLPGFNIPPRYIRDDYSFIVQAWYGFLGGMNWLRSTTINLTATLGYLSLASALVFLLGVANLLRKPASTANR